MSDSYMDQLIDAAEQQASIYDGDDRDCIKTDVMNSFYAGAQWRDQLAKTERELFTCEGKGGVYELIGTSKGAGTRRDTEPLTVYRDTGDRQLYNREQADFETRMKPLPGMSAAVLAKLKTARSKQAAGRAVDEIATVYAMADCMHMVRTDLVEAGIIDEKVPPMFVVEAVLAHIAGLKKA